MNPVNFARSIIAALGFSTLHLNKMQAGPESLSLFIPGFKSVNIADERTHISPKKNFHFSAVEIQIPENTALAYAEKIKDKRPHIAPKENCHFSVIEIQIPENTALAHAEKIKSEIERTYSRPPRHIKETVTPRYPQPRFRH
jgi:hypothetical protein